MSDRKIKTTTLKRLSRKVRGIENMMWAVIGTVLVVVVAFVMWNIFSGAAATIHASNAEEVVLRLLRLGVTQAELQALMPRLYIPVMEKVAMQRGVARRVARIYAPTPEGHKPVAKEEALKDPEVAEWEQVIAEAAGMKMLHSPEAWVSYLRKFD
jgi:hypothetical protein